MIHRSTHAITPRSFVPHCRRLIRNRFTDKQPTGRPSRPDQPSVARPSTPPRLMRVIKNRSIRVAATRPRTVLLRPQTKGVKVESNRWEPNGRRTHTATLVNTPVFRHCSLEMELEESFDRHYRTNCVDQTTLATPLINYAKRPAVTSSARRMRYHRPQTHTHKRLML